MTTIQNLIVQGDKKDLGRFGRALSFALRTVGRTWDTDRKVWLIPVANMDAALGIIESFPGLSLDLDTAAGAEQVVEAVAVVEVAPVVEVTVLPTSQQGFVVAGDTGRYCFALSRHLRPLGCTFDKPRKLWLVPDTCAVDVAVLIGGFPGLSLAKDEGQSAVKAKAKVEKKTETVKAEPKAKAEKAPADVTVTQKNGIITVTLPVAKMLDTRIPLVYVHERRM